MTEEQREILNAALESMQAEKTAAHKCGKAEGFDIALNICEQQIASYPEAETAIRACMVLIDGSKEA